MTRLRVLTMGTFALPHIGHAVFLRRCEEYGELTVGVNSDRFVGLYRGTGAMFSEQERMALISGLGYRVVLNDGPGRELIEAERPDLIAVGTDWARRDYLRQLDVDQDFLDDRGIAVCYVPARPGGISSTEILRRLAVMH